MEEDSEAVADGATGERKEPLKFKLQRSFLLPLPYKSHPAPAFLIYQFQFSINSNRCSVSINLKFISMPLSTTRSLQCSIHSNRSGSVATDGQPMQFVELRLEHHSQLVSASSHQIHQQTSPTLISDALFCFPLRELQDPPFLSRYFLLRFLSSFNLSQAATDTIFHKIACFALELAAGNLNLNFHIIATVNVVYTFWLDVDSSVVRRGAAASVIGRVIKEKYDGNGKEEMGNCCVCCEELHGEKEVSRIPCGHLYHKWCILRWLNVNNSCPLCRKELEE